MSDVSEVLVYNKDNPFPAVISENRILNKEGSDKDTRHVVVNVAGIGHRYNIGDSLGVFATNERAKVDAILACCGFTGDERVILPKVEGKVRIADALSSNLTLSQPARKFLDSLRGKVTDDDERVHLETLTDPENRDEMKEYLLNREFHDILEEHPSARFDPQELVGQMRRLNPRLYSIASSSLVFPEEVHLTVAPVRYTTNDRERRGVCSTFLSDRAELSSTKVPVFVSHSHFGLPEDDDTDIIMVGPGTGIAPFRAFLQEREKKGAKGRNWLFFGDRSEATDYLYGDEFEAWLSSGLLHRVDLAFSRDQDYKIYVQDRIREQAAELWAWIRDGACLYVCGDAKRMAKDVDNALRDLLMKEGGMSETEAADMIKVMKKERRYQRDIY
ncbi:MAG: sulfite reductase subunit alpha [Verrucomicrobia bacterium]|nr:MAG: sulfite reductase subunit alpha [Verrucomicrobiota bacterium]